MPSLRPPIGRRRLALLALAVLVTLVHLGLGRWWLQQRMGFGQGDVPVKAIDVRFVHELALAPPPQPAPAPPAVRHATAPLPAAAAPASAPEQATEATSPAPVAEGQNYRGEEAMPADGEMYRPPTAATPVAPNPTRTSPAFDWPPSTQLRYDLTGNYRGPVKGWAEVKWLREGEHYQVSLELRVPPLFGRRILSDGLVGPEGLMPRRYDQETEVLLRDTLRDTVQMEPDMVQLANGRRTRGQPGLQDTASQFVQMTWLFLTRPDLLKVGGVVEFPLALPNRVVPWRYEVVEQVPVYLPFGEVTGFHLQPAAGLIQPGELSVETWVAPQLQYLPVRIVVRQSAETFLDLQLKSAPLQAAP